MPILKIDKVSEINDADKDNHLDTPSFTPSGDSN